MPDFQIVFVHTRRHDFLLDLRSTKPEIPALIRPNTRPYASLGFLASSSRAGGLSTRLTRAELCCWCHLTSPDDVINPRQPPRKHVHVSKSHVSPRHVIRLVSSVASSAPRHLANYWPGPTQPGLHGSNPLALTVDFDPGQLTLTFALTFDQKSKFLTEPILLSFSHRFQFWILFLHLKLQNWLIDTFFIMVSSKAFFMTSLRDLLVLIQP